MILAEGLQPVLLLRIRTQRSFAWTLLASCRCGNRKLVRSNLCYFSSFFLWLRWRLKNLNFMRLQCSPLCWDTAFLKVFPSLLHNCVSFLICILCAVFFGCVCFTFLCLRADKCMHLPRHQIFISKHSEQNRSSGTCSWAIQAKILHCSCYPEKKRKHLSPIVWRFSFHCLNFLSANSDIQLKKKF